MFVDSNVEQYVALEKLGGVKVDKHFQRCERLRLRRVNDGGPRAIPATTKQACSLSRKGRFGMLSLGDSPGGDGHEKTPCSSRPMRLSASLAPSSVRA